MNKTHVKSTTIFFIVFPEIYVKNFITVTVTTVLTFFRTSDSCLHVRKRVIEGTGSPPCLIVRTRDNQQIRSKWFVVYLGLRHTDTYNELERFVIKTVDILLLPLSWIMYPNNSVYLLTYVHFVKHSRIITIGNTNSHPDVIMGFTFYTWLPDYNLVNSIYINVKLCLYSSGV